MRLTSLNFSICNVMRTNDAGECDIWTTDYSHVVDIPTVDGFVVELSCQYGSKIYYSVARWTQCSLDIFIISLTLCP